MKQRYSWGQLCLTQKACSYILSKHQVFTSFLNILHTFGFRASDNFPRSVYFWQHTDSREDGEPVSEITYLKQYVIENARNRGDPWSIRQTGIYHRWNTKSGHSVWITVHPSQDALDELQRTLYSTRTSCGCSAGKSVFLHAQLLISSSENWSRYIEDLHTRLSCLVSLNFASPSSFSILMTILENQIMYR